MAGRRAACRCCFRRVGTSRMREVRDQIRGRFRDGSSAATGGAIGIEWGPESELGDATMGAATTGEAGAGEAWAGGGVSSGGVSSGA